MSLSILISKAQGVLAALGYAVPHTAAPDVTTWAAICAVLGFPSAPPDVPEMIAVVQTELQRRGLYRGQIDRDAGPLTWGAINAALALAIAANPAPAPAPVPVLPGEPQIVIGADHWIVGAERVPLVTPGELREALCVVEHFTGGADGDGHAPGSHAKDYYSAADAMRDRGVSAHIVIDRDGRFLQCVPFNCRAYHAGISRWRIPATGALKIGTNDFSIGIEHANAGSDPGALAWARKQPGFESMRARHANGGAELEWECFYPAQMATSTAITRALVSRYALRDVTTHDSIAPERKDDTGPAFPIEALRLACGFRGLPAVHRL